MAYGDEIKTLIGGSTQTSPTTMLGSATQTQPTTMQSLVQGNQQTTSQPQWDEAGFRAQNSDIDSALKNGVWGANGENKTQFSTAKEWFDNWGKDQGREGVYTTPTQANTTNPPATSAPPTSTAPTVKDNSSQYKEMYDQSLAAARAALQASIQQSMGTFNKTIADAPGTFNPLENKASVTGAQNMQNLQEMLGNNGQQGGVNRTEETQVNANTENQINGFEMQKQKVISDAKQDIADLQSQGNLKDAELVAQNAQERIKALIDEANRVDTIGYARGRDTLSDTRYTDETAYNRSRDTVADTGYTAYGKQTIAGKQADASIANTQANTVGQLIQNQFAPQIAQGTIDAQKATTAYQTMVNASYPQEEALKIAGIISQNKGLELDNQTKSLTLQYQPQILQGQIDGQKLQNAYQALVNNGYPTEQAAKIASIYANISQGQQQIDIARQNAANGRSGGGGNSGSSGTSSKASLTQEAWSEYGQVLSSNGSSGGSQWLESNKSAIIDTLGQTAYNEMVKTNQEAATQERSTSKAGSKQDTLDSRR